MHEILMGFSLTYWSDDAVIEGIEEIAAANFPGFEAPPSIVARYEERLDVFREILERTDLELVAIYNQGNFLIEDRLEEDVEIAMNTARFLHRVGAQFLVVSCGPRRPEGNTKEDWTNLLKALDELGNRCLDSAIQLCVMQHHGTIIETREDIDRLMDETPEHCVFFCPDLGELRSVMIDPVPLIADYFDRIPYVRFRDVLDRKMLDRKNRRRLRLVNKAKENPAPLPNPVGVALGDGLSVLQPVWDLLNEREFDGWAMTVVDEPRNAASTVMEKSRQFLENYFEILF